MAARMPEPTVSVQVFPNLTFLGRFMLPPLWKLSTSLGGRGGGDGLTLRGNASLKPGPQGRTDREVLKGNKRLEGILEFYKKRTQ